MKWLQLVLQFFPTILQMIMTIEVAVKALPVNTPVVTGLQKKAIAMAVLQPSADQTDGVSKLIDTTVGALNSTGIFTKDTPVAV